MCFGLENLGRELQVRHLLDKKQLGQTRVTLERNVIKSGKLQYAHVLCLMNCIKTYWNKLVYQRSRGFHTHPIFSFWASEEKRKFVCLFVFLFVCWCFCCFCVLYGFVFWFCFLFLFFCFSLFAFYAFCRCPM